MYRLGAFLISTAALTSIFSFFFGEYYRKRERAYRFWLMFVAYGKELFSDDEKLDNRNDKLHRTPVHQSCHGQNQKVPIF